MDQENDELLLEMQRAKEAQEEKMKSQKDTYIQNLTKRVMENLVLTVEDIYLRYENDLLKPFYSCGLIIKQITFKTVDKDWKTEKFVDRTSEDQKHDLVFKICELKHLGVFWNSNDLG